MNEKRNRWSRWIGSLIVLAVVSPTPFFAQDLNQKIIELEKKITQLEKRIVLLERIILELKKTQQKPLVGVPERWKDKAAWRLLKKGMNKDEVRQILGEPPKIVANVHYGDIWLYPDMQGGNASFDKDGVLISWSEI